MTFELSQEYLDKLKEAIDNQDVSFIQSTLDGVNVADISSVLQEFDNDDSKYVFDLLDQKTGA